MTEPWQALGSLHALWSSLIIEELVRLGVRDICIAPGSRSTPLTLAAAANPAITTHLHFDERGLGFLALGLAQGSQRPVAVIVTSGSAVANLLPAVVEARQSGIPLWLLTADRPTELIGNGANQAIDQSAIFSSYPIYQQLLPTPNNDIAPAWVLASVDQAAFQQQQTPGPVHLNCAFREPLYPIDGQQLPAHALRGLSRWFDNHEPWTRYTPAQTACPTNPEWEVVRHSKGLIVVGQLTREEDAKAILQLAEQTGWPLITDIQSQLRFHPHAITYADLALHHPAFRAELVQAETLLLFGGRLISKRLQQFLTEQEWQHCWQIDSSTERLDNGLAVQQRFVTKISNWCQAHQLETSSAAWHQLATWDKKLTALIEQQLPKWGEITLCHQLNAQIKGQLFIGNSMPIRILDMLGTTSSRPAHIYTNRGASGIDGLIATAAGVAKAGPTQPTTVLLGDTSALFDLNSLALLSSLNSPFVLIIINNDGGNIFHMLPVPEHNQIREHFYQLPHGLNFQASAEQFQLAYAAPMDATSFQHDYQQALTRHSATILECKVAVGEAANWLKGLAQHVRDLPT